ncbi:uncharacterized protein LOC143280480 [Babylonia areolata]|uniref:uncharacterized protein LOC143280480 n=1 Tax=Babylonia areolata TaxID=304850 RepID=UPI003FD5EEB0
MAATAAILDPAATTTGLYPRLYPTLENPTVHFAPIQTQAEEEVNELQEEGVLNGEREEEEGEEEGNLATNDRQDDPPCQDPSPVMVSPSQASADSRAATADAGNSEQTTNGDDAMTDPTEGQKCAAALPDKLLTDEAVSEGQLTVREEYVDKVWEEFVTHFLLGSCHIQKAAIFDLATRRPLAMNGNLRVSSEELEQLITSLHYIRFAYRSGVTLEGKTYKVRLADGRNGILARTDREGCTVCKTHSLVIVGVHDERGNSRKCNEDVMRLGDFFRKKAV